MNKNIKLNLGKIQNIFINPYYVCNNNCSYCLIKKSNNFNCHIKTNVLQYCTKNTLKFIKAIQEELDERCQFVFLGGEPLLTWNSWLIPFIKELNNINPKFQYRLSTNGTLLTSDKYKDIEKYNININLSLDGPQYVHDLNRKSISGTGCFDLVYNNLLKFPNTLSDLLYLCATVHLNTVKYLSEIFNFMIEIYEKHPFNWFTLNETDGYEWLPEHFILFEQGMYQIKNLLPVKFKTNFIPNPPCDHDLIINFFSGLISVKSNELSNPIYSNIENITKKDNFIFKDKLNDYHQYHLQKNQKKILPYQSLCEICPGKNNYCIQKNESFFEDRNTYINLKNFCQHNYILNKVFEGGYYDIYKGRL